METSDLFNRRGSNRKRKVLTYDRVVGFLLAYIGN